jgi:hypothetical protein
MAIKKELIQFTLQNTSDCAYNIPMMQNNNVVINSTTEYQWDITSADLSCGYGTIVINGVTYNITYESNSVVSLVAALNNLGFGFFCFRDCSITSTTTSTTSSTTTAAPTTSTTTSTTTAVPTTSTTTTSTTGVPTTTTSTTTTSTTGVPTTSTTTSTTTDIPTTTTSTTTSTSTIGFETYSVRNSLSDLTVCAQIPFDVYTALGETITTGTTVYTNTSLTLPFLNGGFIVEVGVNVIYNISSGSGQIQAPTGGNC